jgi:tetratricopeptide (TPR) repeat protein
MSNSKSPLKGPHSFLIPGAYDAAGNRIYQHWVQKEHDALMAIGDMVAKWDFGSGAKAVIDRGGALPPAERKNLRKIVSNNDPNNPGMKQEYENADDVRRQEIEDEMTQMKQEEMDYMKWQLGLANQHINKEISESFYRTDLGKDLFNVFNDEAHLVRKKCDDGGTDCANYGQLGLKLTDYKKVADTNAAIKKAQDKIDNLNKLDEQGLLYTNDHLDEMGKLNKEIEDYKKLLEAGPTRWSSFNEITNSVKLKDNKSKGRFIAAKKAIEKRAFDSHPDSNVEFDINKATDVVNNAIIGDGDLQSLIHDDIIPGRTFYKDLVGHIKGDNMPGGLTYRDFGVSEEMIANADMNLDGKIDDKEAETVANAIIGNNALVKKELGEYLLESLKTSHEDGVRRRDEQDVSAIKTSGGDDGSEEEITIKDRDDKGVWINDSEKGGGDDEGGDNTGDDVGDFPEDEDKDEISA